MDSTSTPTPEQGLLDHVRGASHRRTVAGTTGPVKQAAFAHGYQAALADITAAMADAGPDAARGAAAQWIIDNGHDNVTRTLAAIIAGER